MNQVLQIPVLSTGNGNGSFKVQALYIGPRLGKRWQTIVSEPGTEGEVHVDLLPGRYRTISRLNGFASSRYFTVNPDYSLLWDE